MSKSIAIAFHSYRGLFWLDKAFETPEQAQVYCTEKQAEDDALKERAKRLYQMEIIEFVPKEVPNE